MVNKQKTQSGAVSIFVVLFFTILVTILTVGFIKLMVGDQQQSTNSDLSQSAYDAALAGVEDAKRVIRACASSGYNSTNPACIALNAADDCKVIARSGINGNPSDSETIIQSTGGVGGELNQAYTCANIELETPDFVYDAADGVSRLIPLRATAEVSSIVVQWLSKENISGSAATTPPSTSPPALLPTADAWGVDSPPVMRAQIITPGENFDINSMDNDASSQTIFVRPIAVNSGLPIESIINTTILRATTLDREYSNSPEGITCSSDFSHVSTTKRNLFSCSLTIALDTPMTVDASKNSFLRLTPIYRNATVGVELRGSSGSVNFDGAQPLVDVTGRASNLFRRIEARLEIGDDFPYPNYAIDVEDGLCKDFSVDGTKATPGTCDPT